MANGRPQRREDLASWYSEVLADQEVSGLSVGEYAVALGVTPTTLYLWRRRLSTQTARRQLHSPGDDNYTYPFRHWVFGERSSHESVLSSEAAKSF